MRLTRFIIITLFHALLMCVSCTTEQNGEQTGAGRILPEISVSADVYAVGNVVVSDVLEEVPAIEDMTMRLTAENGGFSATWHPLSAYYPDEPVLPGAYNIEVYYGSARLEGFDVPYFYGAAECVVKDGEVVTPEVSCTFANTMVSVEFDRELATEFDECALTFHSNGGGFITYGMDESRKAYLRPGNIEVGLYVKMSDGTEARVHMLTLPDAKPGHWYVAEVGLSKSTDGYPVVTVSFDDRITADDISVCLSPDFLAAPAPEITCSGFESGVPVSVTEGETPTEPLSMSVNAEGLSRLLLSATAPSLIEKGWFPEVDLLSATDISAMEALGLKVTRGEVITVDYTNLIQYLKDTDGLADAFALQAESRQGKQSAPAQLLVNLRNADVNIVSISMPVVGVYKASVKVECSPGTDPRLITLDVFDGRAWINIPVTDIEAAEEDNTYVLSFTLPAGTESQPARLSYCGQVRETFELYRVSPEFSIDVDAYALKAVIKIVPSDPELLGVITGLVQIYANGSRVIQIDRDEDRGQITVTGLKENTTYRFSASVMSSPEIGESSPVVTVTTERASGLPNGNFEDVNLKYTKYSNMPSGGRYSQNIVEIFNLQNYTSFNFTTPLKWATVNSKTFNLQAKKLNTWYVVPSVRTVEFDEAYAGTSYAVRIDNVAWDNNGADIKDYLQESQPYVKYSRNVPPIKYKAVGKLFIGSYRFDQSTMSEVYDEGVSFGSRPSALNGFYRFIPAGPGADEAGYACVEVLSADGSTIARGESLLAPATGYTAFSVPLQYASFGVKAAKIKVMIAASPNIGDIKHETATAVTVANPETSTSTGSSMCVDELSFSY